MRSSNPNPVFPVQLAQEGGGPLAMTEEERRRLEQLLTEEDDLENAFSIDQRHRRLLNSLDDRLSVSLPTH